VLRSLSLGYLRNGIVLAGGAVLAHSLPSATRIPAVQEVMPSLIGRTRTEHVALTFDDGPDPLGTPRILDVLADLEVKATFFLLGEQVVRYPDIAKRVAAEGHEIALHGWHHRYSLLVPPRPLRRSLDRALEVIDTATGATPRWYRPPYGVATAGTFRAAKDLGLTTVLWSQWGLDWQPTATSSSVLAALAGGRHGGVGPGDTILLHDSDITSSAGSWRAPLGALRPLVDGLRERDLTVGPLADHGLR
jgi:peptidoglycan/xylan/chitin deacetylase (PgdA/CDA1 family)